MTPDQVQASDGLHVGRTTTGAMLRGGRRSGDTAEGSAGADGPVLQTEFGPDPYPYSSTIGWHWKSSGPFLSADSGSAWDGMVAYPAFPGITTSPGIERRETVSLFGQHPATVPSTARQVRELQAALSVNKSELARILRVSRPTVYDWLDDGVPNAENVARIQQILRLLQGARVSSANPLFPRLVRFPHHPGTPALLDMLREETLNEPAILEALRRAKATGDAIDRERDQREARLRAAGFEEADDDERKANLASNVALMNWPRG